MLVELVGTKHRQSLIEDNLVSILCMRARDHTGLSLEIIHPSDSWATTQNKTKQEVKN